VPAQTAVRLADMCVAGSCAGDDEGKREEQHGAGWRIPHSALRFDVRPPFSCRYIHTYVIHTLYIHTYIHYTYIHTLYIHTYIIHTYIHTYRHTDIQTYIHTYVRRRIVSRTNRTHVDIPSPSRCVAIAAGDGAGVSVCMESGDTCSCTRVTRAGHSSAMLTAGPSSSDSSGLGQLTCCHSLGSEDGPPSRRCSQRLGVCVSKRSAGEGATCREAPGASLGQESLVRGRSVRPLPRNRERRAG